MPIEDKSGVLYSAEGCSTISDLNGSLLFYTNGDTMWDRNHIPMPNGLAIGGAQVVHKGL